MPQIESLEDLPVYHDFVMNRLKLAAQNFYDSRLADVVDAELKEIMAELPEEITMSWLVKEVVEDAREYNDEPEGEITLIIEDMFDWTDTSKQVYISKEEDTASRDCDIDLHLSLDKKTGKWDILSIRSGGQKEPRLCAGRLYHFEKMLFNVYAMKGQIDLDQGADADDYETSWSEC